MCGRALRPHSLSSNKNVRNNQGIAKCLNFFLVKPKPSPK